MIKTKTVLEVKIGERTYNLECSPDSPYGELHDALCMMQSYVVQTINEFHNKQKCSTEQCEEKHEEIDAAKED